MLPLKLRQQCKINGLKYVTYMGRVVYKINAFRSIVFTVFCTTAKKELKKIIIVIIKCKLLKKDFATANDALDLHFSRCQA